MKKILLIIDDEKIIHEALSSQFDRQEVEVLVANNGKDGLKTALKHHPDLILLDLIMPKMDGMTMLGKLREDEWGEKAEVIILTNLSDAEKINEAVDHRTYEYLIKVNWNIIDLVKRIRHKLGLPVTVAK